jgi:hypothetical protein
LFLGTLGKMMRFNATRFQKLKEASASIQQDGMSSDLIIELLMEASVATNFVIQEVASLEQVFISEHPHLNTVYRVFANLVFVEQIQQLTSIVTKKSPIASTFSEKDAVEFLGDAIECVFRSPSDPSNKGPSLVRDFLKRWQFRDRADVPGVKQLVNAVQDEAGLEVEIGQEKNVNLLLSSFSGEMQGFTWLCDEYIGMNRSITHTIRLVQSLSNLIKDLNGRLISRKGCFGPDFDPTRPVSRIQVEMDELLMGDVLPLLINMCY